MPAPLLVVFAPWPWDFVCQRPQQLMSRLAGRWQVLFVEEPRCRSGPARLEVREAGPGLSVLSPQLPLPAGPAAGGSSALHALLATHLQRLRQDVAVAWLYTPAALPVAHALAPACIVYDCIDQLPGGSAARGPLDRELALIDSASLVFTGGPSLYEVQRHEHPRVYCLPCAVDVARFAPARLRRGSEHETEAESAQGALARPRLGYCGVIDRRIDFALLTALADSHPQWSVVMAGPLVGVDAADLPRRPNLHWLGPQPVERLPYLAAGWDLCLLPFVHDDTTRFLNPSQTLEYMAAEKPVVSTPIRDVLWLYGDAVAVAPSASDFVQLCAGVLDEGPGARGRRVVEMFSLVFMYAWDRSADSVHKLMSHALARASSAARVSAAQPAVTPP